MHGMLRLLRVVSVKASKHGREKDSHIRLGQWQRELLPHGSLLRGLQTLVFKLRLRVRLSELRCCPVS